MSTLRIPVATYRFQFNSKFPLDRARELLPYLSKLGITDLYCSPLFQAVHGSAHGYDVTNPTSINPELGGQREFDRLAMELRQYGMGLVLDIVPNHMAASVENPWWLDVLRHGPESPYAEYFDVEWQPFRPGMANKVLLPILGGPFGKVLENRELTLQIDENGFWVCYYDKCLPLSPASHSWILEYGLQNLRDVQPEVPDRVKSLINIFKKLPPRREGKTFEDEFQKALEQLWCQYTGHLPCKDFVDRTLVLLNGRKGDPASFNALERLLDEQAYRLAFWRVASEEINYRRFFNVSGKVSLHVEKDHVFKATHSKVLELVKEGLVTGLRIDHIDGLYDPREYLGRLQEPFDQEEYSPGFYIVVEKILGRNEELPPDWPVFGTTGYDFLNVLNNLFVERREASTLDMIYDRFSGLDLEFDDIVYAQKRRVMGLLFTVEIKTLARQLYYLAEFDRHGCDFTLPELRQALTEIIACFPVYRTYISDFHVSPRDKKYIEKAIEEAVREFPDIRPVCDYLRQVLLLDFPVYLNTGQRQAWLNFVMRWQQFTGPIMAKGFEDTALYVYNQLVSLNEVGGDPRDTGISVSEFHRHNKARQQRMPHTFNTTSTHDTKRSEDVRARINIISEIPEIWASCVKRWRSWNQTQKPVVNGQTIPDGNTELLIYQTLIGAWPLEEDKVPEFEKRLKDYLVKSSREAKVYTSWMNTNDDYENGLLKFVTSILEPREENRFLSDFKTFQRVFACYGAWGSIAQVLLKITSPGVPDFYQGNELWNFSLVDPDNRRPVNFEIPIALLKDIQAQEVSGRQELIRELVTRWQDGRIKLYLTYKALHFRRQYRELFASGEYIPVDTGGYCGRYTCVYARCWKNSWALVVVPRLLARMRVANCGEQKLPPLDAPLGKKIWKDGFLVLPEDAPGDWQNIFTGELLTPVTREGSKIIHLADVFARFPVALLEGS